jgi:hypothetical protein
MLRCTMKPEIAMSFAPDSFAPDAEALAPEVLAKPEALFRVPVGLASPLWGLFAGAAMTGATWWWMTRWARPQNLEAMFAAGEAAIEPEVAVLATPVAAVIEAIVAATPESILESVVEATPEPVMEALVAVTPEPIVEALVERFAALEPVVGDSAPLSPALEALAPEIAEPAVVAEAAPVEVFAEPAPKPKKKTAALPMTPKSD